MNEGRKDDQDKLRYDLIPPGPLAELARVYTIGAKKYDDRNWEKGIKWGRIFAAIMRHLWAYWRGERLDPVDGQHHLASVAWGAFALMEFETTHPEMDDRPSKLSPKEDWRQEYEVRVQYGCDCAGGKLPSVNLSDIPVPNPLEDIRGPGPIEGCYCTECNLRREKGVKK